MMRPIESQDISVIAQGELSAQNITKIAHYCAHWRVLFPESEIILSISSTLDLLFDERRGRVISIRVSAGPSQSAISAAAALIMASCDRVVLAPAALPLPPARFDSQSPNNVNLQISAARSGMNVATRRYALRTRNDLIFLNGGFVRQWEQASERRRGNSKVFNSRILVSSLFTLNPYSYQRLPFHVSDWFNFGHREDVKRLWDVKPMQLKDAIFHTAYPPPDHSNLDERKIQSRLAPEQHITVASFIDELNDKRLSVHNELSVRQSWIDMFMDNFIIADTRASGCIIDKYQTELYNPRHDRYCINRTDWLKLVELDQGERISLLEARFTQSSRREEAPFPRRYPASVLSTQAGRQTGREIMSSWSAGVVSHGPYDTLPAGNYLATFEAPFIEGPGEIRLEVTCDKGLRSLASRTVSCFSEERPSLDIAFGIPDPLMRDIEVVLSASDIPALVVDALVIERTAQH